MSLKFAKVTLSLSFCFLYSPFVDHPKHILFIIIPFSNSDNKNILENSLEVISVSTFQDAVTLEKIRLKHDKQTADPSDAGALLHRVVFIDSTWQQSHPIITVSLFARAS